MHLRFVNRVHVIIALVIVSVLTYSAWIYPSLQVRTRLTKVWTGTSRKLVVFGDSFSDTGAHTGTIPKASIATNDEPDGIKWSEVLCKELVCDTVLNFARTATNETTYSGGVVVDNSVYTNTTTQNETLLGLLPDLKEQIQGWIDWERQANSADADEEYVFAITLGFWDIWQYATLDLLVAQNAISSSIHILFEQLDILAESFDEPVKIILPRLWDVSFTPRFMSLSTTQGSQPRKFSEEQHKLIFLIRYWNTVLVQYAANWKLGHLYLPDWNTWLLDQIRNVQMTKLGIFDSLGLGKEIPAFEDVSNPCLRSLVPLDTSDGSTVAMTMPAAQCERRRQHLFWDDTQFSAVAHQLLGAMAAKLLHANETSNAHANLHLSTSGGSHAKVTVGIPRLVPSLAPGN